MEDPDILNSAPDPLQPLEALMKKIRASEIPEEATIQAAQDRLNTFSQGDRERHADRLKEYRRLVDSYIDARKQTLGQLHEKLDTLRKALPSVEMHNKPSQSKQIPLKENPKQRALTYEEFSKVFQKDKKSEPSFFGKIKLRVQYWLYLLADGIRKKPKQSWLRKMAEKFGLMKSIDTVTKMADAIIYSKNPAKASGGSMQPDASSPSNANEASPSKKTYNLFDPKLERENVDLIQSNSVLNFERDGQKYEVYFEKGKYIEKKEEMTEVFIVVNGKRYRLLSAEKGAERNSMKDISKTLGAMHRGLGMQRGRTKDGQPAFVWRMPMIEAHIDPESIAKMAVYVHKKAQSESAIVHLPAIPYLYTGLEKNPDGWLPKSVVQKPSTMQLALEKVNA